MLEADAERIENTPSDEPDDSAIDWDKIGEAGEDDESPEGDETQD